MKWKTEGGRPIGAFESSNSMYMKGYRVISFMCALVVISGIMSRGHAQEDRRIQTGDRLQITVIGRAELTRSVLVRSDGTITFPFLGEENVTGFSLQELRVLITARLRRFLEDPVSAVDVAWGDDAGAVSQLSRVTVLGQVRQPGTVTIDTDAGLQGAITAAGGLLSGSLQRNIKVHRITGDGPTEILVDLDRFYGTGDLRYLPVLQEGDVIIVPGGTASSSVRVLGAVINPGNYQPPPGATVFDMIVQAGGFDPDARTDKVKLVKPSTGVVEEYAVNMRELFQTGQEPVSPPVEPGDVILVQKRFISYRRVFNGLRDLTSVISLLTLVFFIFRR